jgi:hypothetical protein
LWDSPAEYRWVDFQGWFPYPVGIISFIGLLLNSLVIAAFIRWRKADKKLNVGGVHLVTLAVSDITYNLGFAMGFVLRLLIENNLISRNSTILRSTFGAYLLFTEAINRVLTLFITITRFSILLSFGQAHRRNSMTERENIRETICFGVLPGAMAGVLFAFLSISESAEGGCHD